MQKLPQNLEAGDLDGYQPTRAQAEAKARLQKALQEAGALWDLESLTIDQVANLAGTQKVRTWVQEPRFAAWFFDQDSFQHRAQALRELALGQLEEVLAGEMDGKNITGKTKLDAAKMLLELTGSFPSRTKEVRWLDSEVGNMDESETEKQLSQYREKLAGGTPPESAGDAPPVGGGAPSEEGEDPGQN